MRFEDDPTLSIVFTGGKLGRLNPLKYGKNCLGIKIDVPVHAGKKKSEILATFPAPIMNSEETLPESPDLAKNIEVGVSREWLDKHLKEHIIFMSKYYVPGHNESGERHLLEHVIIVDNDKGNSEDIQETTEIMRYPMS